MEEEVRGGGEHVAEFGGALEMRDGGVAGEGEQCALVGGVSYRFVEGREGAVQE